jgi:hypothetical protein
MIGNEVEVERVYLKLIIGLGQSTCKILTNLFIKILEPNEELRLQYFKGAELAPSWWPPITGPDNIRVRYKDPDQLLFRGNIAEISHA